MKAQLFYLRAGKTEIFYWESNSERQSCNFNPPLLISPDILFFKRTKGLKSVLSKAYFK